MQAIGNWFQRLYETTGLNFSVFYDAYDWDRYFAGLKSEEARKRNLEKVLHVLSGRPGRFMARDWNM